MLSRTALLNSFTVAAAVSPAMILFAKIAALRL